MRKSTVVAALLAMGTSLIAVPVGRAAGFADLLITGRVTSAAGVSLVAAHAALPESRVSRRD